MPKMRAASRLRDGAYDAGTLWRMTRHGWTARCALWSLSDTWELRVTVDAEMLFSQRGANIHDLFGLAEQWKARMARSGWTRITPAAPLTATVG